MEYHPAIKRNKLLIYTTLMSLKIIMLALKKKVKKKKKNTYKLYDSTPTKLFKVQTIVAESPIH